MHEQTTLNFFMSALTPNGFKDKFHTLEKLNSLYLLKGPAGSGKSTFIKKVSKLKNESKEHIHCSLDVNSLDALILNQSKTAVLDATPPHTFEPKMAGAFERVVSLYDFFDNIKLNNKKSEIERLRNLKSFYISRAQSFISAAGMLISSSESLSMRSVNREKLVNFISRLCLREIKKKKEFEPNEKVRYLSTLNKDGIFMFTDTATKLASKIYIVEDEIFGISSLIMMAVRKAALNAGYSIYTCLCPMSKTDKIDHIFIPQLSLGFMTSNKFHPILINNAKKIHTKRFKLDNADMYKMRSGFQLKAAKQLLLEAGENLSNALETHKNLENIYISSADFSSIENYTQSFLYSL